MVITLELRMDMLGNDQFILKIPNSSSNLDIKTKQ